MQEGGIMYYHGQHHDNTKELVSGGNKVLMGAFENPDMTLYLFEDSVYSGECKIIEKPFFDNGSWKFPIKLV